MPSNRSPKASQIPSACPPILKELLVKLGGIQPLARESGIGKSSLALVRDGRRDLTPTMGEKLAAFANRNGIGIPQGAPPAPPPPFTPWDGKSFMAIEVVAKAGKKPLKFKKCPTPLAEALRVFGGSRLQLAKALGYSHGVPVTDVLTSKTPFNEKMQRKIHELRHGGGPANTELETEDTFQLGVAVCLAQLSTYERLEEIAEVLGGALLRRKSMGGAGWLCIWRFSTTDKTRTFKRLAHRDAKDIVCP